MEIIKGRLSDAQKIVIYGPEGIGKSTFASQFPKPLFIDTEGSTKWMNVDRTKKPLSWSELYGMMSEFRKNPGPYQTLVLDTADWAEILCMDYVCASHQIKGIEDIGYGKGYTYVQENFGKLLNFLSSVTDQGIHVVITAHAKMRKFELPDQDGQYDRWELKLSKGVSPLVKEWADAVLFVNYKTYAVRDDNNKVKARGGKRVMYTSHHPCWDAKNRYGLPEETEFDYSVIAPFVSETGKSREQKPVQTITADEQKEKTLEHTADSALRELEQITDSEPVATSDGGTGIPAELRRLMEQNDVTEHDIQVAVGNNGYYPADMPVASYDPEFINGKLIAGWDSFYKAVLYYKELPYHNE